MTAFSDYLETQILNGTLRNTAYSPVTTVYLALFTADTGLETNAPTAEVSGGAYARQAVTFGAPAAGVCANSADVTFPQASANWGIVTHAAVMDALTLGNVLYWGALTASKDVQTGDTVKYNAGDFTVTLD